MIELKLKKMFVRNNILKIVNLNLFDRKPQKDLYSVLAPLKRAKFANNELIIFYCLDQLHRQFDDEPCDLLVSLQKVLVYLDIPNSFCKLVSNVDLSNDLQLVSDVHAVNETPIENIILNV